MRASTRIKSLGQPATYRRAWRSVERRMLVKRALADIDARALEELRRRHPSWTAPVPRTAPEKYLDVAAYLEKNVRHIQGLGLHRRSERARPKRILDLGCGAGFFLFLCQELGYDVLGLDVGDVPLYDEMLELFKVRRVNARVDPFVPLPPLEGRFDWVTAFATVFNRYEGERVWGTEEWSFFLDDVERTLAPGGRIFLDLNPALNDVSEGEVRWKSCYTPELLALFQARGATVDRSRVLFPPARTAGVS